MLTLLVLLALQASVVVSIDSFFCDYSKQTDIDGVNTFYVHTVEKGGKSYLPVSRPELGSTCSFSVSPRPGFLHITVKSNELKCPNPSMRISRKGNESALTGVMSWGYDLPLSSLQEKVIARADEGLDIVFENPSNDSTTSSACGTGIKLLFQFFAKTSCPPDWVKVGDVCVGFGEKPESFWRAQKTCNFQKANLYSEFDWEGLRSVARQLFTDKVESAWLGVHSLRHKGKEFRLMSEAVFPLAEEVCWSESRNESDAGCAPDTAPCVFYKPAGELRAAACAGARYFLCSMPLGGASVFYFVPSAPRVWPMFLFVLMIAIASLLGLVVLVCLLVSCVSRHRRLRDRNSYDKDWQEMPSSFEQVPLQGRGRPQRA